MRTLGCFEPPGVPQKRHQFDLLSSIKMNRTNPSTHGHIMLAAILDIQHRFFCLKLLDIVLSSEAPPPTLEMGIVAESWTS